MNCCIARVRYAKGHDQQLMGDVPVVRTTPSPPFLHCRVNFAGPLQTKMSKGCATTTLEGHVCVFVCIMTKAVHLKLVSDLSTEAFLAAFKRFTTKKGLCSEMITAQTL